MKKLRNFIFVAAFLLLFWPSNPLYAAVYFADEFDVSSHTELSSRTPDVGTSWSQLINNGRTLWVRSYNDHVTTESNGTNVGALYQANATYPSADYEILMRLAFAGGDNNYTRSLAVRIQDANNMYLLRAGSSSYNGLRIYKRTAGTWTELGFTGYTATGDTNSPYDDEGDIVGLRVQGNDIMAVVNGSVVLTVTDTDHTNAGVAGIGTGYVNVSADDSGTGVGIDNVIVRDLSDITAPTITSISSDTAAGLYNAGDTIDIDVTFSEAVTSNGNVTVTLETGSTDRTCTFTVSSSTTGTCDYTVQAGDVTSDLDATVSGNIKDQSYNSMTNFTPSTSLATNEAIVVDASDPTATLSPLDDATSVAVDANLVMTFNEAVDAESGNITIYKTSDDSTVEVFDVTADISGSGSTTITIDPTSNFDSETEYYVIVDATAFDDAASNSYAGITASTTWSFTTIDASDPTATLSPTDDATGVAVDANLVMTFNEAVDAESGNITIYKTSDDSTVEAFDVTADISGSGSTTITVDPTLNFDSETEYYVIVDATAFDDIADNSYAGITASTTWSFTTVDISNPTATLSPLDDATGVAVDANLVMTFNEAVDAESGNITIYKTSDDSTVEAFDVTADISGSGSTTITIDPSSDFSYETEYYVIVDATAFDDAASNSYAGITASTTWSFATADTPTCSAVDNAATYNAWPTCGVATCNDGYTLSDGACESSSGGAIFRAPIASGIGANTASVNMGEAGSVGVIDSEGSNILTYIDSQVGFQVKVSSSGNIQDHNLFVTDLDMSSQRVTITIKSDPIEISLMPGETKKVDLDGDGIDDVEVKYVELFVNRVELTIIDLFDESGLDYESKLIKYKDSPKVYLVEGGKKRWIIDETTFNNLGYKWIDIILVEDINFDDGITISIDNVSTQSFSKFLEFGIKSEDVKKLQEKLKQLGYFNLDHTTYYFGPITLEAVIDFQLATGIINNIDDYGAGYVGPKTNTKLNSL